MSRSELTYEDSVKRYETICQLRKEGMTLKDIGLVFNISHQAVSLRLKKGRPKPYISEHCFATRFREHGIDPNSSLVSGTNHTRMIVRIRDEFTCQDCGLVRTPEIIKKHLQEHDKKLKHLDIHHLEGLCGKMSKTYDSKNNMDILITLCHKCHFNRPEHTVKRRSRSN